MQLYALDNCNQSIMARYAKSKENYFCLECGNIVRARKGRFRKAHFYHISQTLKCSLRCKSLTHIALQEHLYEILPDGEVQLEKRFSTINRIADVAWLPRKLIFEIQCSPIDEAEVRARNRDYKSIGFETVWILHDKRYNKWRHTLPEKVLQESLCYYTNFNQHGKGIIYDQFEIIQNGVRKVRMAPLPVDLTKPFYLPKEAAPLLKSLTRNWGFEGDLLYHCIEETNYSLLAAVEERKYSRQENSPSFTKKIFLLIKSYYLSWLDKTLERIAIQYD